MMMQMPIKKSLFIGIDPGSKSCGYSLLVCGNASYTLLLSGAVRIPSSLELSGKLLYLYDFLFPLLQKYKEEYTLFFCIERPFSGKNSVSFSVLSCVRGVLLLIGAQLNASVYELSPCEIKQGLISGSAKKDDLLVILQHFFPSFSPTSSDESDAVALAFVAATSHRC